MTVVDVLSLYLACRAVSPGYARNLRRAVTHWGLWLGRQPDLQDLSDDTLSRYLVHEATETGPAGRRRCRTRGRLRRRSAAEE